jgi:hypothetical protein
MKKVNGKKLFQREFIEKTIIVIASIVFVYLLISCYFANHFFFNTVINGANVSLKSHHDAEHFIKNYIKDYKLQLIERNGETEEITGQDVAMRVSSKNSISKIFNIQKSLNWAGSIFKKDKYYLNDLYVYKKDNLNRKINKLNCLTKGTVEPQNADFKYANGFYEVIEEVYGNKIKKDKLIDTINIYISKGKTKLYLDKNLCYENPTYTLNSEKTIQTRNLLNQYVATSITYKFDKVKEILDGSLIHQWLSVDNELEVALNKKEVMKYVKGLSKKYDTVGIPRKFKTSSGKSIEVKGGLYGWKINKDAEIEFLLETIRLGTVLEKEPIYLQKAFSREDNEIGNTYVEISITKQRLWFYKEGKLLTQGLVVTGNPNRGFATVVGTYMLNYKQRGATLAGPGYEVDVTYWMPFFGNMGIHDARWRHSFGGEIYKRRGTHGCVNAPLYLAKTIYENIEEGIPIIIYEE